MSFIVKPLALVDVTVSVHKLAMTVSFVVLPLALVLGAIGPSLRAVAVSQVIQPLPGENRLVLQVNGALEYAAIFISLLPALSKLLHNHLVGSTTKLSGIAAGVTRLRKGAFHTALHGSPLGFIMSHSRPNLILVGDKLCLVVSDASIAVVCAGTHFK